MKYIIFFSLVWTLVSCKEVESEPINISKYVMDKRYCISECVSHEFKNFHNSRGFGGSSSMDGLSQTNIYKAVQDYCKNFYSDLRCCEGDYDVTWKNIITIHGYDWGPCDE